MFDNSELVKNMDGLKKFALRLTGNVADGEDLLHSTILRALEKRHLFEDNSNFMGWSSKIMFNIFVSQYRRKTKFETKFDPESFIEKESVGAVQETMVEASEVAEAINSLSPNQRQILVMVCAEGRKYEEVAAQLDIPVGTVRSRLARARASLQEIMDGGGIRGGKEPFFVPPPAMRRLANRPAA
jgi:RNA polymerase sigma-70 factor (ECF subfamily)